MRAGRAWLRRRLALPAGGEGVVWLVVGNAAVEAGDALDEAQVTDETAAGGVGARLGTHPVDRRAVCHRRGGVHECAIVSSQTSISSANRTNARVTAIRGRIGARLTMRRGNLRVTLLQLDAGDDHFPLLGSQPLQRRFVSFHGLVADRFIERRR